MEKTQQHIEIDQKETLLASGFDLAIIGLDTKSEPFRVVYDIEKMIEILCSREEMTELDAIEYLDYNVFGAYVGEGTPIYIHGGDHQRVLELLSNY